MQAVECPVTTWSKKKQEMSVPNYPLITTWQM